MATEFPIKANVRPAVQGVTELENALRKAGKEAGLTENEINDIVKATNKVRGEGSKNINDINKSIGSVNKTLQAGASLMAGFFAVDRIKAFVSDVIKVTSEFQKLEAVLSNTLGSRSLAQAALKDIQKFAATTPFSVSEAATAFLKLANNGIKPTVKEMRSFADVAANAGKGIDSFAEAANDATRGEFERLKEFFISGKTLADKYVFTFKGMTFETEKNAVAVKEALVQMGQLNGVAGATEAISKTLTGQISNLNDNWEQLLVTIGQGNSGVFVETIGFLNDMIGTLRLMPAFLEQFKTGFAGLSNQNLDAILEFADTDSGKSVADLIAPISSQSNDEFFDNINKNMRLFVDTLVNEGEALDEVLVLWRRYVQVRIESTKTAAAEAANERKNSVFQAIESARQALAKNVAERTAKEKKDAEELKKEYEKLNQQRDNFLSGLEEQDVVNLQKRIEAELGLFRSSQGLTFAASTQGQGINVDESLRPDSEEGISDTELEAIKERVDARIEAEQVVKDFTIDAINEVFNLRVANTQREIAMLDAQKAHELSLVGDNENAKSLVERRFERQRVALLNKQAQQQQQAAIFNILSNQGPAVAKTASTLGFPLAIPFVALVLSLFALTLANQRKVAAPRFAAEGDFDIEGPGTETSDSIAYMLSRGESVTPAAKTRKFGWLLKPMIEDKHFSEHDLRRLVDTRLPNEHLHLVASNGGTLASDEVVAELRLTRQAIEKKREVRFSYNEEGFNTWVGREREWVKKANRRYTT